MHAELWNSYPQLTPGHEIHLTPRGGTFFAHGAPANVVPAVADFLTACDGRHRLVEAMPNEFRSDYEDIKLLGFVMNAIRSGWLEFQNGPSQRTTRVTGSRTAFYPPHLTIELTVGCNLRCDYCYRESDATKLSHMPTEELLELIDKLWAAGLRTVELTGGEPTVHRDFRRILARCADKFDMVGVLSNGTRLNDELAQQLAAMGEKLMFSVSLDASTPDLHDARRGVKGAWLRTTRNIARLAEMGVAIRVSMVVDERNFDDIENTLLLARNLGAKAFSYSPLLPLGRGKDVFSTKWKRDGMEVLKREQYLAERYKGFLGVLSEDAVCEVEGEEGCGAGYRTFAMDPWGNIRPCATFGADEIVFGNLRTQSFEEVFGQAAIFAMKQLRAPSPEFCSGCSHADFCHYCVLRGLHASEGVPDCAWRKQPAIAALQEAGLLN